MLVASLLAIFWLQPSTPIRNLDFWLPTLSILLTIFVWAVTQAPNRQDKISRWGVLAFLVIVITVLLIGITRYLGPACCLTKSRPPEFWRIGLVLCLGIAFAAIPLWIKALHRFLPSLSIFIILIILITFVVLKSDFLGARASAWLRSLTGQPAEQANVLDLAWLGFSFLAFRLLHVLLDFRAGKLPIYSLREFVTFALFFPTVTAGPIDRSQHFIADLREPKGKPAENLIDGGERIVMGLFKKFVIADSLALVSLNGTNASQINSSLWMWVIVYSYALRIYFDFSGYTDLALGLGRWMGVKLPPNFDRPYLKSNMTAFWNSWHMTLAQWFRAYYFNPLTRFLRSRTTKAPVWSIILIGQLTTMLLIGLWHGLTWNYAAWGLWQGVGLFIHNRWLAWSRSRPSSLETRRSLRQALQFCSWLVTFNYIALGWVLFALPNLNLSWRVFQVLFGV